MTCPPTAQPAHTATQRLGTSRHLRPYGYHRCRTGRLLRAFQRLAPPTGKRPAGLSR